MLQSREIFLLMQRLVGSRIRGSDVVSQVEGKLKLDTRLPREILEKTRASLRILKVRNPIGCFGKYDNDRKRACALLEYEVRDYKTENNKSIEVDMELLAKAAFMKLKDFRDFHEKLGNFRDNIQISQPPSNKKRPRNDATGNNSAVDVRSKSGIVFRKSSIPSLAIQLGAFVPNSSNVASRAQKLFSEIIDLLKKSSKKDGIYGLRDVQKNQNSYEAACFYLIARPERGRHDNNTSTLRHRRSSKTNDEGDDYHQLDLASFLKITKVSSQFQMILDYVDQLRNDIESNRRTRRDAFVESQRSQKQFSSSNTSKTKHTKVSKNRRTATKLKNKAVENLDGRNPEHNEEDVHISSLINSDRDEDGKMHRRGLVGQNSYPNSTFGEWRSKVLLAACEDAKQNMNANNTNDDLDSKENQRIFRREDILDFVVEGILERNGIV